MQGHGTKVLGYSDEGKGEGAAMLGVFSMIEEGSKPS